MMLNTYGLKMTNLIKVSRETINSSRGYSQIDYDKATGELLEAYHSGTPAESWTEYHDANVIRVCNTTRHMTPQQLADAVYRAVNHLPLEDWN